MPKNPDGALLRDNSGRDRRRYGVHDWRNLLGKSVFGARAV